MAQLSALAELIQKMHKQRGPMSPATRGARGSTGSRFFKSRNSMAGLMKERKTLQSPIINAMMGS